LIVVATTQSRLRSTISDAQRSCGEEGEFAEFPVDFQNEFDPLPPQVVPYWQCFRAVANKSPKASHLHHRVRQDLLW
jgi:hypothetical protein